jgi:anti-anti-sigma regulatory factor
LTARIDLSEEASVTSVRVTGRLEESAARELLELCQHRTGRLLIDLTELVSVDRVGIDILKDLRDAGARFAGASPYIQILLNSGAGPDSSPAMSHEEEESE